MRQLIFGVFILFIIVASCTNSDYSDKTAQSESITLDSVTDIDVKFNEVIPVSPRDYTIDSLNSYSTLFTDSVVVDSFVKANNIGENIANRMISFYNSRNYQYAWFSKDGPTEQGRGFWNMYSYFLKNENDRIDKDSLLSRTMERYVSDTSIKFNVPNSNVQRTELQLTRHFITYALKYYGDRFIDGRELQTFIPAKKTDPVSLSKLYLELPNEAQINDSYERLLSYLKKYQQVADNGGWPVIEAYPKDTSTGKIHSGIKLLKQRLFLGGFLSTEDTSDVFTQELKNAILNFQSAHGFKRSGILTSAQLKAMNVPVENRIEQMVLNLDRAKWFISKPKGRVISVNIPEFILRSSVNDSVELEMNVVVGKEGSSTTMFTGKLNTIAFSPYWNVPYGITKNEVWPGIQRRGNAYLQRQNMEVVGKWGDGIPRVRQQPGPTNSLGKVKFLFPNSYDIYFHDTPNKSFFNRDVRAYSHGCIRLSKPKELAMLLLGNDTTYTSKKIDSLMNLKKEHKVNLKSPVPVIISYYTAWVDANGMIHFAGDIYNHDKDLAKKMFEPNIFEQPDTEIVTDSIIKKPAMPIVYDTITAEEKKDSMPVSDTIKQEAILPKDSSAN